MRVGGGRYLRSLHGRTEAGNLWRLTPRFRHCCVRERLGKFTMGALASAGIENLTASVVTVRRAGGPSVRWNRLAGFPVGILPIPHGLDQVDHRLRAGCDLVRKTSGSTL